MKLVPSADMVYDTGVFRVGVSIIVVVIVVLLIGFGQFGYAQGLNSLHSAAEQGDLDKVRQLLTEGENINARDSQGNTPLHVAAANGQLGVVEALLEQRPDVNARNGLGRAPLHLAVTAKNDMDQLAVAAALVQVARTLLDNGSDVGATDNQGTTPLHLVTTLEMTQLLLARGAEVDAKDNDGATPLHYARNEEVAQALIDLRAAVETQDFRRNTPLHYAATAGVADSLLNGGANPRSLNAFSRTPLHLAALRGRADVVERLLRAGARVQDTDRNSATPLHYAGNEEVADKLLTSGADFAATDNAGAQPLHYARSREIALKLIDKGADVDSLDLKNETPLHYAARHGLRRVLSVLLEKDADPRGGQVLCVPCQKVEHLRAVRAAGGHTSLEQVIFRGIWPNNCAELERLSWSIRSETNSDGYLLIDLLYTATLDGRFARCEGWTPLHYASRTGPAGMVGELLEKLGNQSTRAVQARSLYGDTALLWHVDSQGVVNRLLQHVDNKDEAVRARNVFGDTPLHRAKSANIMEELLRNVNNRSEAARAENVWGITPLHNAQDEGSVIELVKANADLTATDDFGYTPLHSAAEEGFEDVVLALLEELATKPTDVLFNTLDKKDSWRGQTALFLAAGTGRTGIVHALLIRGADPTLTDRDGVSPLHVAAYKGVASMVRLLLDQERVDPNSADRVGDTPLHYAASEGAVRELLAAGANPSAVNRDNETPLHRVRAPGAVRVLQVAGADVEAQSIDGFRPLHSAARRGYIGVVLELLEAGASPTARTITDRTPLHLADDAKVVRILIDNGAAVNATDRGRATPLHLSDSSTATRVLILAGADLEAVDHNQQTPLHHAVTNGFIRVVEELLNSNANVHATDSAGKTPLHHAAESPAASADLVNLLIARGARCDETSSEGDEPLDLLKRGGYRDIAEIERLLRSCQADEGPAAPSGQEIGTETPTTPGSNPALGNVDEFTNSVGMVFVTIPSGNFQMGSSDGDRDEAPVTNVQISTAFRIGKHEVTQGQWQAVMGNQPSMFDSCGSDCPVEQVSWEDAQDFVNRLNRREPENSYRLPTEAEWEYAARSGTTGDRHGAFDEIAWHGGNSGDRTHPVGMKQANGFGLHDMIGNVEEWVQDWYGNYSGGTVVDPTGSDSGTWRVLRGCSWSDDFQECRSANRRPYPLPGQLPGIPASTSRLGLRVVMEVE